MIAVMKSTVPSLSSVGTLLIAGAAGSAVVLSLAMHGWLVVCHGCQRSKTAITQRLSSAETTRIFNQHKAVVPRAARAAGVAAATGQREP